MSAHAQFTGHRVAVDRRYPTEVAVPSKYGAQVVAAKGSYFLAGPCGIKVTGTQITVSLSALSNKYAFEATTYNGYRLTATDGTTPAITGVAVDPQTRLAGFDASRVSFAGTYMQLNLAGLAFGTGDRLVLNVGFPGLPLPTNPSALIRARNPFPAREGAGGR